MLESLLAIAQKGVELAQNITFSTGDFDASSILALVKTFLGNLDIAGLVQSILALVG